MPVDQGPHDVSTVTAANRNDAAIHHGTIEVSHQAKTHTLAMKRTFHARTAVT